MCSSRPLQDLDLDPGKFRTVNGAEVRVLRSVMDLVENPPAVNPYTVLKGRLVLEHQLTPVQRLLSACR